MRSIWTSEVQIKSINIYAHDLKVVTGPYVFSGGSMDALTSIIVRVQTDTGLTGWGEVCPLGSTYQPAHPKGAIAALKHLAPQLIGSPALTRPAMHLMDQHLDGHNYAKAAIDIALWDILGHATGQPVHILLGGAHRDMIPSYYAINLTSPEETAKTVTAKQAEGYRALQIKIGSGDPIQDATNARAACNAASPGTTIACDANRAMTTGDLLHFSRLTHDLPIAIEQPCRTLAELETVKNRISHPIYLDEATTDVATIIDAFGRGLIDGLGMKITRLGGLSNMLTVRDMAAAQRVPISVDDSWGGDIIAAACVHMGATVDPKLFRGTWIAAPYIHHHYDPKGIAVKDGWIDVPQGHGLGITPNANIFGAPVAEVS
jgi:L-alanine-DL-glutamate epimerase-like enolase superfamily enzyme